MLIWVFITPTSLFKSIFVNFHHAKFFSWWPTKSDKFLWKLANTIYSNFRTQGGHNCRNIGQYLLLKQFLTATLIQDDTRWTKTEQWSDTHAHSHTYSWTWKSAKNGLFCHNQASYVFSLQQQQGSLPPSLDRGILIFFRKHKSKEQKLIVEELTSWT